MLKPFFWLLSVSVHSSGRSNHDSKQRNHHDFNLLKEHLSQHYCVLWPSLFSLCAIHKLFIYPLSVFFYLGLFPILVFFDTRRAVFTCQHKELVLNYCQFKLSPAFEILFLAHRQIWSHSIEMLIEQQLFVFFYLPHFQFCYFKNTFTHLFVFDAEIVTTVFTKVSVR